MDAYRKFSGTCGWSPSFLYNIERLSIHEPLDDVARQHCQCGGNHATQRWYDFARQQWVTSTPDVS